MSTPASWSSVQAVETLPSSSHTNPEATVGNVSLKPKNGGGYIRPRTVAVLQEAVGTQVHLDSRDVEIKTCRGSGAGGQHRNVTDSAVQATHRPTGITVRCEGERSQHQNKEEALRLLQAQLQERVRIVASNGRAQDRKDQVGTGQRGDKVRTIAVQRDQVVHHGTGKTSGTEKGTSKICGDAGPCWFTRDNSWDIKHLAVDIHHTTRRDVSIPAAG